MRRAGNKKAHHAFDVTGSLVLITLERQLIEATMRPHWLTESYQTSAKAMPRPRLALEAFSPRSITISINCLVWVISPRAFLDGPQASLEHGRNQYL